MRLCANGNVLDFNPRSPHGERRLELLELLHHLLISIHAPRTGSDAKQRGRGIPGLPFQSTLPARGATGAGLPNQPGHDISIHAPRTGSDTESALCFLRAHISIHAPRTGSDKLIDLFGLVGKISIHAPRTGSDPDCAKWRAPIKYFNPRSPHGERHQHGYKGHNRRPISIHAPRTGSDAPFAAINPPPV